MTVNFDSSVLLGYFNANVRATSHYNNIEDVETPTRIVTGLSSQQRYGAQLQNLEYATRYQNLKDTENAFFGEVNYNVTDEIKVTGGIRRSATSCFRRWRRATPPPIRKCGCTSSPT